MDILIRKQNGRIKECIESKEDIMFKLPVCPNCNSTFYYNDVKRFAKAKQGSCPHCGNKFVVARSGKIVWLLVFLIVSVGLDVFLLFQFDVSGLVPVFILTVVIVSIGLLVFPYFTRLKQSEPHIKK